MVPSLTPARAPNAPRPHHARSAASSGSRSCSRASTCCRSSARWTTWSCPWCWRVRARTAQAESFRGAACRCAHHPHVASTSLPSHIPPLPCRLGHARSAAQARRGAADARGHGRAAAPYAAANVGRRAAARDDRARARQPPADHPAGRAHGRPGLGQLDGARTRGCAGAGVGSGGCR